MTQPSTPARATSPGGMLRFVAIFAILVLASLGFMTVMGVLSLAEFNDLAIKLTMLAGIAGATSIAIWALMFRIPR